MSDREERPAAAIVAVQLPGVSDEDFGASLEELGRLCSTLGLDVVATITQKRATLSKGGVVGKGKLAQLGYITGGPGEIVSQAKEPKDKARLKREPAAPEEDLDDEL